MERDRLGRADTERGWIREHVSLEHVSVGAHGIAAYAHGHGVSDPAAGALRVGVGDAQLFGAVVGAVEHDPGGLVYSD